MDLVESGFRTLIRRTVRGRLGGVWLRGEIPAGGAILALNHHSWWDGYVIGEVCWSVGTRPYLLMDDANLDRLPFFRNLGVLGAHELRKAVRLAKSGELVWLFPEGALCPPSGLGDLKPGAAWLSKAADVPLVPVALRVVLRGHAYPEAFVRFGRPATDLGPALSAELAALDADVRANDPERPLPGYLRLRHGQSSDGERLDLPSRVLASLLKRGWLGGVRA
ncbi:1-acyl-sn-glycerol-3-phosphate acyltransferase [Deinococcus yavapaiensis]|uniref:Acyltransferase-like protein n=1 Tax=Deinococcus yavapaiensis KR-236 TaxID=694435 RepID=A0A318S608_9DEIO|nr:1-acyl-sn-glycerol-3-phosphate acyltransferase [Deinococcus yavapaiensis]PYE53582.1 acyltransferase-like protein [Deinococcus yavapaiensis KR-236]